MLKKYSERDKVRELHDVCMLSIVCQLGRCDLKANDYLNVSTNKKTLER